MPRKGDGITRTASGGWRADAKVKETVRLADGTERTTWKGKTRVFETYDEARDWKRAVADANAAGKVWRDERTVAVVTLGTIADAFVEAVENENTKKTRRSYLKSFTEWAGKDTAVTVLTASYLEDYAKTLPGEGRKANTRHRKVLEVESMWEWARGRPDRYPGVPEVCRITGKYNGSIKAAPPVVRTASPTFADADLMIANIRSGWKYGDLPRRIAILLRYTGWRVSQAIGLRWTDVHLDYPAMIGDLVAGPYFVVRAGARGSKSSKGRAIPIHPALAAEMAGWGVREGLVFDPGPDVGATWEDGEACRTVFRTAWEASGVERAKWDVSEAEKVAGDRSHGTPTHAFRSAVKVGLLRAGISEDLANYYVGHSKGATTAAYVPEHSPETSPYWPHLVQAVATIPPHSDNRVRHLHPRWGT